MMEDKLDRLFRNRISTHKVVPSEQAWEKIRGQLHYKKRMLWIKRLAVAASLAILFSISFIGYQTVIKIETGADSELSSSDSRSNQATDSNVEEPDEVNKERAGAEETPTDLIDQKTIESAQTSSSEGQSRQRRTATIEKSIATSEPEPLIAKLADSYPAENEIKTNAKTVSADPLSLETSAMSDGAEENINPANTVKAEISVATETERAYPQIRIVFKADRDSKLIASSGSSFIAKGINKITEFSEEHVLTTERKTKLRSTKDDLLALNFGKLLNKSNKALEN